MIQWRSVEQPEQAPQPALGLAVQFANRWFWQLQQQRFAQWRLLLGSAVIWLQVAVIPLLFFVPLPILRLLEPDYPATAVFQWMVFTLLCAQTLLRSLPLTAPSFAGGLLLWPHPHSRLAIRLTHQLLSQWLFWLWSLIGLVIALGFMRGPLAWTWFVQWLLVLVVCSALSARYCSFIGCFMGLPWLVQQGTWLLICAMLLEWLLWQLSSILGAKSTLTARLLQYAKRSVTIGFLLRVWQGKSLLWPLLVLLLGMQLEQRSEFWYWAMAVAFSLACLQCWQAWRSFMQLFDYAAQLLKWKTLWWPVSSVCLVLPWVLLTGHAAAFALLLVLLGTALVPQRFALIIFGVPVAILSFWMFV
ncbi:MAG TPA: hypothetical protein DCS87_06605 [Rheinheimera sp.]|nr:hypothetical protein [Rheinheimera sp.]